MSRFARPPFFIVGCVRSGTTMLRQVLERHPALVCPEETHLFRWPYPFGTPDFQRTVTRNRTLMRHREIDGIGEEEFAAMLDASPTRRGLIERYMAAYAERHKPGASRWFEKSPQNVYGLQLIDGLFPDAHFLHIVRHPLDVVSSLKLGAIMKVSSITGAANYWLEAVAAIHAFGKANGGRLWQVRYEDLTRAPESHLTDLLDFLDEPMDAAVLEDTGLRPKTHREEGVLTRAEVARVWEICGPLASARFGYEPWPVPEEDAPVAAEPAEETGAPTSAAHSA